MESKKPTHKQVSKEESKAQSNPQLPSEHGHTIWASIQLVTPKEEKPSREPQTLKYIDSLASLIKALGWPIIVLLIFLMLKGQIFSLFEQLPYSQSTKIAVGSFSFEVKQAARQIGDPQLAKLLEGLSPEALSALMEMRSGYQALVSYTGDYDEYTVESEKVINIYKELEKSGLVEFTTDLQAYYKTLQELGLQKSGDKSYKGGDKFKPTKPLSQNEQHQASGFGVRITRSGEKALDIITAVVVQQFQRPKQETKDEDK